MLFNTLSFLLFFPVVCIISFLLRKVAYRNLFLLLASYYFYMNWKPIYALLLLASTVVTYGCGLLLERYSDNNGRKKLFLVLTLLFNFGILFIYKYYNFINGSIHDLMYSLGIGWPVPNLNVLLPVGISFYTFMAVGYTIDVYRGQKAERNFITYALFVSFFPQVAAGPIGRSYSLLPQFKAPTIFNYDRFMAGVKMMLWGYFLKLCLADRCGIYVDAIFNNVAHHNGGSYLISSLLFTFQIYGDFAGYSLIAIGAAKVMGFQLMENFHMPYFSTSVGEFWHRWHISLSTWFRDYLYIPLGGNRVSKARNYFNLFVTFMVSGIWHGANWTFFCWGSLHGILLCIEKALKIGKKKYTGVSHFLHWLITFILVTICWTIFRANNLSDAIQVVTGIFTSPGIPKMEPAHWFAIAIAMAILATKEFSDEFGLKLRIIHPKTWVGQHLYIALMIAYIILFGVLGSDQFIYFQF